MINFKITLSSFEKKYLYKGVEEYKRLYEYILSLNNNNTFFCHKDFILKCLEDEVYKSLEIAEKIEKKPGITLISLPTKKKRFSLLRSPHKYKKSFVQFVHKRYRKSLFFKFSSSKEKKEIKQSINNLQEINIKQYLFLLLLKNLNCVGVETKINLTSDTYLRNNNIN